MKIEEEIQGKFEDEYHRVVVNLSYTYGWLNNLMRGHFEKFNLTSQQFNVLRILRGQYPKPSTVNLLKERMLDKMSDASRIVDRLVQKGLVSRCTNNADRRAVDIRISDDGLATLAKMDKEFRTNEMFDKHLTVTEAETLSCLLDKFRG